MSDKIYVISISNNQLLSFSFREQVLIPNGAYSGQKLIKLVKANMAAKASSTIARVPLITLVI